MPLAHVVITGNTNAGLLMSCPWLKLIPASEVAGRPSVAQRGAVHVAPRALADAVAVAAGPLADTTCVPWRVSSRGEEGEAVDVLVEHAVAGRPREVGCGVQQGDVAVQGGPQEGRVALRVGAGGRARLDAGGDGVDEQAE